MEVNLARLPLRKISRELNIGTQVSLTLSLHIFYLTEENLKIFFYSLKYIPMKALEARSDTGWLLINFY